MRLTDEEKREMLELAASASMREDADLLRSLAQEELHQGGEIDPLRVMQFLTDFNAFLNHPVKEYRPFLERIMKL